MLSTSSLQAFSSANTTGISRPGAVTGANPIRLVQAPGQNARQASPGGSGIPDSKPSLPPPRGSLLNLSV